MIFRKLLKNRGLGLNLLVGLCFIVLLVKGWGLSWREIGEYLVVLVVLLGGVIGLAALCGWLLHKLTNRNGGSFDQVDSIEPLKNNQSSAAENKTQK